MIIFSRLFCLAFFLLHRIVIIIYIDNVYSTCYRFAYTLLDGEKYEKPKAEAAAAVAAALREKKNSAK